MLYFSYYSVTVNESKETFKIDFCYFLAIKNIVAALSSSNFPMKLICWGMVVFVCFDKSMPMSL